MINQTKNEPPALAEDLLRGASEIAVFMYGSARERKKVYHLAETTDIPAFRMGGSICARRSSLMSWIEKLEGAENAGESKHG